MGESDQVDQDVVVEQQGGIGRVIHGASSVLQIAAGLIRRRGMAYAVRKLLSSALRFDSSIQLAAANTWARGPSGQFAKIYPKVKFKHLSPYLATSLSVDARARVVRYHYEYLAAKFSADFLNRIFSGWILLWRSQSAEDEIEIGLTFPKDTCYEGDLAFVLRVGGQEAFDVSCTFASGADIGVGRDTVLVIGRVQGRAGLTHASKSCKAVCLGISPSNLLMSAVQAIAQRLGVKVLIGVGNDLQIMRGVVSRSEFLFSYDDFWQSYGGKTDGKGFFKITVPFARKPLSAVSATHRSGTRRRREFKDQIAHEVDRRFRLICMSHIGRHVESRF